MKIEITSRLKDTKEVVNAYLSDDAFVPRVGDIVYFKNRRYIVDTVIIDFDFNLISVYVKDKEN